MAEVQPFRGWRYDLAQVGDLSDVTCPPYDVINADQQEALYKKHPCNIIRLELNREEPGDADADERYRRAEGFLRRWIQEGVLMQEREDALYVYHQEFTWEGETYVRKGFLGRIRLEPFGEGAVYPHEQTLSGPKADRLKLYRACKMNLSPVFGLFPDAQNAAQAPLEKAIIGATPLQAKDTLGVVHRFWPVTDPQVINQVREQMRDKPIFIADGHHRYETACNYWNELKEQGNLDANHPANFALMMFVGMSDPGLAILPTHRLVAGFPDLTSDQVAAALKPCFEVEVIGEGDAAAQETWDLITADGSQHVLGFGTTADKKWILARLTDHKIMQQLVPQQSDDWRNLGVSILHELAIKHLLGKAFPQAQPQFQYVHLLEEVLEGQNAKKFPLGCLVPPAQIIHVEQISKHFERMPPKSTYFYPKLQTGLVFHALD
ncbi:MAG: DUF1015 domain-containing protein [Planctomycetales bacterium]